MKPRYEKVRNPVPLSTVLITWEKWSRKITISFSSFKVSDSVSDLKLL
jgi:hypothetical protein